MMSRISVCIALSASMSFCSISALRPGRPVAVTLRSVFLVRFFVFLTSTHSYFFSGSAFCFFFSGASSLSAVPSSFFFSVAVGLLRVVAAAILGGLLLRVAVLLGGGLHLDIGLDLRGRGLLAGLDRNLALFLHNLLVLLLFNHLSTLDGESAMKRETSPDLDFLGLGLGRQLNVEGAELLRRHWQKGLLVGKFGLNVERGLPEERQGLQKVHRRARREHRRAFELAFDFGHPLVAILLLGLLGRWSMTHPTNVDGERRRVLHLEVPDFVQRRQDRSLQGATSCDTLLLVHGRRQLLLAVLAAESLGAELFHPGHAGTAADHFHNVDLFHCQA
mmetsp:Transcript_73753/g.240200  ORF Transcript_73753/g.240200 Transcript_73753/m.240200 type:complete len:333 (+) Transcript_73753:1034-2032(+)